ncbi:MAG: RloB family protein [Defluviitaleaceae bacterium]|nr:RloB family protein [Defluviitaleaceae bacterium]
MIKNIRKIKEFFEIFVEGETEEIYFDALKQLNEFRNSNYKLKIINCKGQSNLLKIALAGKNGKKPLSSNVAFIFDKDHISKQEFDKLMEKKYTIGFSNPKFELWLLAHYEEILPAKSYSSVENDLKHSFPNYSKKIIK